MSSFRASGNRSSNRRGSTKAAQPAVAAGGTKKVAPDRRFRYQGPLTWNTQEYTPPRKISDQELAQARKMFFELDRDASGSIDAEELGFMLKSLGQNPTDEELRELIVSRAQVLHKHSFFSCSPSLR